MTRSAAPRRHVFSIIATFPGRKYRLGKAAGIADINTRVRCPSQTQLAISRKLCRSVTASLSTRPILAEGGSSSGKLTVSKLALRHHLQHACLPCLPPLLASDKTRHPVPERVSGLSGARPAEDSAVVPWCEAGHSFLAVSTSRELPRAPDSRLASSFTVCRRGRRVWSMGKLEFAIPSRLSLGAREDLKGPGRLRAPSLLLRLPLLAIKEAHFPSHRTKAFLP